ncbi:hypothetical protein TRVL_07526 [Trypanosoma vivax]|nr:hypothetical protein TRVL_07526 [Trypanosoma vivax]
MEAEIRTDDIYNLDSELRKDTAPGVSIQPVYLLYRDDNDHIELLRRILQEYPNHRVLLLTHHKEVRPMYQLISRWNIFGSNGSDGDASPGSLSCMLRTDTVEQQEAVLLRFVGVSTSAAGGGGGSGNGTRDRGTPSLLIAWDAFTAADIMDIDVLIQYYPPQKSIEQRERVEFMHVLHTTADPRVGAEGRRTVLFTLLAPSDFTLVDFFMQQNGLRMFVMNIAPRHPHFGTCVSNMGAVLRTKLIQQAQRDPLKEEAEVVRPVPLLMSGGGGVYSSFSPSFRTDRLPLN